MDAGYISAVTGLLGAAIGGLTSFGTTWVSQVTQANERNRSVERTKREKLFGDFVLEASRLYGDALSHQRDDVANLVQLYALVSRMRLVASAEVIAAAEEAMGTIIQNYLAPNRSLHDLRGSAERGELNLLRNFTDVCRRELDAIR